MLNEGSGEKKLNEAEIRKAEVLAADEACKAIL